MAVCEFNELYNIWLGGTPNMNKGPLHSRGRPRFHEWAMCIMGDGLYRNLRVPISYHFHGPWSLDLALGFGMACEGSEGLLFDICGCPSLLSTSPSMFVMLAS